MSYIAETTTFHDLMEVWIVPKAVESLIRGNGNFVRIFSHLKSGVANGPPTHPCAGDQFLASLAADDLAVVAAQLQNHCDVSIIAVAPEPAVIPCERGLKTAFTRGLAPTSFVGHILTTSMSVKIEVDPSARGDPRIGQGGAFLHRRLDLGGCARRESEGDLVLPASCAWAGHEQAEDVINKR